MKKLLKRIYNSIFTPRKILKNSFGSVLVDKLISVYDGDTFKVTILNWPPIIGEEINIRISGIDAPEMNDVRDNVQQLAEEAKQFVTTQLRNAEKIELFNLRRDKYFRIIADVYLDGEYLNDLILKNNLAKPYDGTKKEDWT